ncbi:MAG: hypothetical protein H6654_09065 [Ardenticatenaceae bacterium]|nr:hypothetical protein [Ardenticatenaceae bacterium]
MKHLNKHLILLLLAALLFGTVATACGGEDPTPTPRPVDDDEEPADEPTEEPEPTDEPEPTAVPTEEPTAEPTADPSAGFTDFSNDVLGVALSYPEDWAIEFDELGNELKLASSQTILEDSDDNIEGAIFNMLFVNAAELGSIDPTVDATDPVQILGLFVDFFAQPSEDGISVTVTQEPTAVTINGQSGAEVLADATDEEGDTAVMKIMILMADTRAAIVLAGAETSVEAENRPILDSIANSIVLSTPVGAPESSGDAPISQGFLLYGDVIDGSIDSSGPSVWDFVGLEGESIDIIIEPEGELDIVFDVLDESGVSILPNGEIDLSFGTEEIRGLAIPASGLYYISVRGFADATGNYTLTIVEAGGAATLPPVTGGVGTPIAYGDQVSGVVDGANPTASFSFAGLADDIVGAVITPAGDFDAVVDVVDAAGNSLLTRERDASFGPENVIVFLPEDGVYTINVYGFDGSTGSFDMQFGIPLTNVVFAAGDTLEADDEGEGHSFPFNALRSGDMVGIYVEPAEDLDVAVQVRQDGELMDGLGFDPERGFDAAIDAEEFVMLIQESGVYSFRVLNSQDDFAGNTGDYEVTLFGTPEVVFELAYGDSVDARTNPDGLIDYYIRGTVGDSMVINALPDDDSIDLIIEVLDLDENVLATIDDAFSGEAEQLVYTFASDDLVIIRISDWFGGEGNFIMSVDLQ